MKHLPALLCLAVAGLVRAAPDVPVDSIAERTRACTACHGKEGRSTPEGYFPRIAGKPEAYLYHQLLHFREGRRSNTAMTYLVQHLSDAYLHEIAAYFAALDLPYAAPPRPVATPEVLQRGEALALRGDPARELPACVQCHGRALTGVLPAMPGLLGLPRDYVVGQIGSWRTRQRQAGAPDCMAKVSDKLTPEDIGAVAAWLAAQPLPLSPKPAAALPERLPMPCGSAVEAPK